jgi:hypothetical protein
MAWRRRPLRAGGAVKPLGENLFRGPILAPLCLPVSHPVSLRPVGAHSLRTLSWGNA